MIASYFQYNLCEDFTLKMNVTSDALVDTILWSANSTDTGFRNEKWESKSSSLKAKTLEGSTTYAYHACDYRTSSPNLKYEYTEHNRMYVADNDECFVK